ncbi:MAG: D-alanyl-D-alanine carboxypeptidase [Rhodoglobus sp.]|nr:D-alanyl-D-alanine carboxypeptidase [Rhodoglobus sp.]
MPLTRRQIYRRRRITVFGGGLVVLATAFYLPLTLLAPLKPVAAALEAYTPPAAAQPAVAFPGYGASGVGAVGYPGVLASAGSTDPLPIASISKIITALVVLDAHPLALGDSGPDITFGDVDQGYYDAQLADGGVVESVSVGQVMTQRNVMNVMLMESANNYAESLATWGYGSEPAFITAATAWLAAKGLTSTTIEEPTGVSPNNRSTVADLIELAKLAEANPVIAEIVSTQTMDVPDIGTIENRNGLLGVDGVDGIKTGTLDEAGACLLFSQEHAVGTTTITVVGVVLGGPDHDTIDAAIRSLLAEVDAGFTEVQLTTAGQEFASYETPWGDAASAVAAEDASVAVWSATPVTVDVSVDDIHLAESGSDVGKLVFTAGTQTVTVPLELSATIDDPGPWWRLTNPGELF